MKTEALKVKEHPNLSLRKSTQTHNLVMEEMGIQNLLKAQKKKKLNGAKKYKTKLKEKKKQVFIDHFYLSIFRYFYIYIYTFFFSINK